MTSSLSRHPAFLSLQGGINFRDLGGQLAADGRRVRSGKLLRSGALNRLTAEDLNHLDTLPLSRVLDYRDPGEVARTPDKLSPLTHYLNAPANPPVSEVNAKVTELNAATLNALNGEQFMLQLYRQLPFNNPAYRQLAAWLTTPFEGALLQHCAVGKDRTGVGCALTLFAVGCDSETVMEEYLLTHGMLTQVEAWMLELLGNDLTAQGRQSLADILTVKSPISPPRCRLFTSAMAPSTPGWRQSTSLPRRFAPRCRPGCWKSNRPLPARRAMLRPPAGPRQPRQQGKNVISYTSDLPVQRNAHIMRSHLLSQSLTKACVALISHTTLKTMKLSTLLAAAFAIVGFCNTASAVTYPLPTDGSRLVGQNQVITIPDDNKQPLEYFAAKYQMGLSNMLEANPGVDTYLPKGGSVLNIPQQLILPDTVHEGIIINSAEMRLYYYPKGTNTVIVLPIGIGQLGKDTPINWTTKVERKKAGPTWTPTAKMHAEYAAAGNPLPAVVPAGPDNPMGLYALYIGRLYAIHGTNANFGIGLRVSHGCVRLRNDDIKFLFENVPVGTRVQFIDEPVKATTEPDGSRYIEVHNPLSTTEAQFQGGEIVPITLTQPVQAVTSQSDVDQNVVEQAIQNRSGMPVRLN